MVGEKRTGHRMNLGWGGEVSRRESRLPPGALRNAQLEAQKRFVSVSVMGRKTLAVASLEGGLPVTRPGGGRVVNR